MPRYDVVIVGSGFGGAVMAARIGEYARDALGSLPRVLVLERGGDSDGRYDAASSHGAINAQGNRFRHSLSPNYLAKHIQLFTDQRAIASNAPPSMSVIAGSGVGGGSNVYCGVSLRAPTSTFEQVRDGRRLWPAMYTRASLEPYYARAESKLRVHRMQWTDASAPHWQLTTKRDFVFAEGCRRIGATALPLAIADDGDANEGWWTQGQRFEGRQNLTKNYLLDALHAGVEFQTGSEVHYIAPTEDGYVVRGIDRRDGEVSFEIECAVLLLAAGAVATTGLLLNSRDAFTGDRSFYAHADEIASSLGRHVSANGDYGVTGRIGADFAFDVEGQKGKPMSSFCPSFFGEHRFIVIPFYAEPVYPALTQISSLLPAANPFAVGRRSTTVAVGDDGHAIPDWGAEFKAKLTSFTSRVLTMGCLALDSCEGEILPGTRVGEYQVRWNETHPETEARWNVAIDTMRRIYEALGGEMYLDTYRRDGTVNTAHPLGGARMAEREDASHGIVDPFGEVFGNPNLFVVDGSAIPSALGVNPSLTIAAVAEMTIDRLITGNGTVSLASRLAR